MHHGREVQHDGLLAAQGALDWVAVVQALQEEYLHIALANGNDAVADQHE